MINIIKKSMNDPRYYQIFTLVTLLGILLFFYDFAPSLEIIPLVIGTSLLTQYALTKFFKVPAFDYRSPLITSLSLCLLFKASALWFYPLAALLAIGSKFFIRAGKGQNSKHVFNPANFGIVALLLLFPDMTWISPGQWGNAFWFVFVLMALATIVLAVTKRSDMTLLFLASWIFFVFGRALWLGDPISIPILSMQSGALLIFAFFMISDPKSTPDHFLGRAIFAFATAALGYILQYHFQVREGLFIALFFVSMTTPLIDMFFKANRYQWRNA